MQLSWYVYNNKVKSSYLQPLGLVTFDTENEAELYRIRLKYKESITKTSYKAR